jgi:hypothetical protein
LLERVATSLAANNAVNSAFTDERQPHSFMIIERVLVLKMALA